MPVQLAKLRAVLVTRALAKGLKPGTKPFLSYVCGTLDRERNRLQAQMAKERRKYSINATPE